MARGWESKSVESQIQDAETGGLSDPRGRDAIERDSKRSSLEMSRRRVLKELESTSSELRRTSLRHALDHLDAELGRLE